MEMKRTYVFYQKIRINEQNIRKNFDERQGLKYI